jgi:hypothetical protein
MNSFITLSKHEIIQRPGIKFCRYLWPCVGKFFKTRAQKYSVVIKLVPKGETYLSFCTAKPQLIAWQNKCACEGAKIIMLQQTSGEQIAISLSCNRQMERPIVFRSPQASSQFYVCIRAEANDPWTTLNIYFLDCFHYAILICARRSGV